MIRSMNILCLGLIVLLALFTVTSRIKDERSLKILIDEVRCVKCMYLENLSRHMLKPVPASKAKYERLVHDLVHPLNSLEDLLQIGMLDMEVPDKLLSELQNNESLEAILAVELLALRAMKQKGGYLFGTGFCGIPGRVIHYHALESMEGDGLILEGFLVDYPDDFYREYESGYKARTFKVIDRDEFSIRVVIYEYNDTIGDTIRLTLPSMI